MPQRDWYPDLVTIDKSLPYGMSVLPRTLAVFRFISL